MSSTILVVDDDADLVELLTGDLSNRGFHVLSASNGVEAFRLIQSEKNIELVVSDVMMPNGNGLELLKNIKTLPDRRRPAVIVLTGFSDMHAAQMIELGALEVFFKPYNRAKFFETIQKALATNIPT